MKPYESSFSPWKRINDRINAINTGNHKLQAAKSCLDKDYRGVVKCDNLVQLRIIKDTAEVMRGDLGDLIAAVDVQIGRLQGAVA